MIRTYSTSLQIFYKYILYLSLTGIRSLIAVLSGIDRHDERTREKNSAWRRGIRVSRFPRHVRPGKNDSIHVYAEIDARSVHGIQFPRILGRKYNSIDPEAEEGIY